MAEDKFYARDRFGRGIGRKTPSGAQRQFFQERADKEKMEGLSKLFKIATTLYGGIDMFSKFKELGMKGLLKKKFSFGGTKDKVKVLEETDRTGALGGFFKNMLPDLRKAEDRWQLNPELAKKMADNPKLRDKLMELYSQEELARMQGLGFLGE